MRSLRSVIPIVFFGALSSACADSRIPLDNGSAADRVEAAAIVLSKSTIRVSVGDTTRVLARVQDAAGKDIPTAALAWASSDPSIVTVEQGLITPKSTGAADVTASSGTVRASLSVTVSAGDVGTPPPVTPPPGTVFPAPEPSPSRATLPRATVDIQMPAVTGTSRVVRAGESLQAAIDAAQRGDEIVLDAGATYTGSFILREKSGAGWIIIRSNGSLPAPGTRVRPADSVHMARLASPGSNQSTITTSGAASGWRLIGLHVSAAPGAVVGSLVSINGHSASSVETQPGRIILDRMLVRGRPEQDFRRCVTLNGAHLAVIDSWLDECHAKGADSQAIVAWQGSGPFLIQNNHLAGAGENVMFGGSDSRSAELLPSDITIRGNHFYKPAAWKGVWTVKNLLELKIGRRVLVEDNVLENNWADGQSGFAVVFKSTNQSGTAPWSETSDVTFRYNILRNVAQGINMADKPESYPAVPAARFHYSHNVFDRVGSGDYTGGRLFQVNGVDMVTLDHNTALSSNSSLLLTGGTITDLVVTGNIFGQTTYGILGDGKGSGEAGLTARAPGWIFKGNVMAGVDARYYPAGNNYPAKTADIGFVSLATGNLQLTSASPYHGAGADIATLSERTSGAVVR
ncbi:MAG TPA: hypothetical protein VHQ45_04810 [Gemmatimonadaceae bacterium]|nr:hypothetical protein [Gemmatimonadaceae bacterium]